MKPSAFIVIFDNSEGDQGPMTFDSDCEGAICANFAGEAVALFQTRADARRAITITEKFQQLNQAQGKPVNSDFTTDKKFLRIVPCSFGKGGSK